jgi:hypothetical protein
MTVIALGWKDFNASSTPKVLYVGSDMDEANRALAQAGKNKTILVGEIFRGIEDRVIKRVVFDTPVGAL